MKSRKTKSLDVSGRLADREDDADDTCFARLTAEMIIVGNGFMWVPGAAVASTLSKSHLNLPLGQGEASLTC